MLWCSSLNLKMMWHMNNKLVYNNKLKSSNWEIVIVGNIAIEWYKIVSKKFKGWRKSVHYKAIMYKQTFLFWLINMIYVIDSKGIIFHS